MSKVNTLHDLYRINKGYPITFVTDILGNCSFESHISIRVSDYSKIGELLLLLMRTNANFDLHELKVLRHDTVLIGDCTVYIIVDNGLPTDFIYAPKELYEKK